MKQYVPAEQLWTTFKGDLEFEYDHSVYWPALNKLCTERREARKARWIAGGKHIGESEDFLSGHTPTGIAGAAGLAKEETVIEPASDATLEAKAELVTEQKTSVVDVKVEEDKKEAAAAN
jgi:hypothetical protein